MRIEVFVGGWEHDCCGPAIERHERVQWTWVATLDGRLAETHHDLAGLRTSDIRGTVVDVELLKPDRSRIRIPGGSALRGFDDDDDGELVEMYTNQPLSPIDTEVADHEFVVTLEVDR